VEQLMRKSESQKQKSEALFMQADKACEDKAFDLAFQLLLEGAQAGDAGCMHNLGFFYDSGKGTAVDRQLALTWYRRSWRKVRNGGAAYNISKIYNELGKFGLARRWLLKDYSLTQEEQDEELAQIEAQKPRTSTAKIQRKRSPQ
jgi:TPR repeat protein